MMFRRIIEYDVTSHYLQLLPIGSQALELTADA